MQSHHRAAAAVAKGYFKNQIVPVELKSKTGVTLFETDEHIRPDTTMESLAKLRQPLIQTAP